MNQPVFYVVFFSLPAGHHRGDVAEELIDSVRDQLSMGQVASLPREINALARIAKKCRGDDPWWSEVQIGDPPDDWI